MNVRSRLPVWAQGLTQKFMEKSPIKGTNTSPLTEEAFIDSYNRASGAAEFAGEDEIPGEDSALGQPGVVSSNGLNVFYEGDVSNYKAEFEAVLTAKRRGVEYVTYVHTHHKEYSVLRMVNDDGAVEVSGAHVHQTREGQDGVSISGDYYL